MYHVFIVNDTTFKCHLEYLFAGTYASGNPCFLEDFKYNNAKKKENGTTPQQELAMCGMVADISRIRPGDKIIFYLVQGEGHEGMFFGVFTAADRGFFDPTHHNFLLSELKKCLNFRVQIVPDKVFEKGITEREALDSLAGISHPSQMCWSLIYRKLKAARGCTMITDYEAARLSNLISTKNNNTPLQEKYFTYDSKSHSIKGSRSSPLYIGSKESLDIYQRMFFKIKNKKSYEAHLQAYIVQHIDTYPFTKLLDIDPNAKLWIGNEVSCGVGMQRIDIMTQQIIQNECTINIIELKDEEPSQSILTYQLPRYVEWVKDYIAPLYKNTNVTINRLIIAPKIMNKDKLHSFIEDCKKDTSETLNNIYISPIKYIGYTIKDDISFVKLN